MIRVTTRGPSAVVDFPYDATAVEVIRTIAGRRWDASTKTWTIPSSEVRLLATRFHKAGFDVTIDGRAFTPNAPTPAANTSPLLGLFMVLPERLRVPVYRALSRVLHPDTGGDTALMQQLNNAKERTMP